MNQEQFQLKIKEIEQELRALKTVQGPIKNTVAFSSTYTGSGTMLRVNFADGVNPIICISQGTTAGIPLQIANNSQLWQFENRPVGEPITFMASRPITSVEEA